MTAAVILESFAELIAEKVLEKMGSVTVEPVLAEEKKKKEPAKPANPAEPELSLVDVRAALGKLSQAGKQQQVKDLIAQYGVKRLSDIDPAHYTELMKTARGL
jgi:hypothetical protein